jgi:hypothetical protein
MVISTIGHPILLFEVCEKTTKASFLVEKAPKRTAYRSSFFVLLHAWQYVSQQKN